MSLANLQMGMFDTIKIDKSFVDGLAVCVDSHAIVGGIVGLARRSELR
jgi:sensor c-di-GMP phosphodiesterase-like protein